MKLVNWTPLRSLGILLSLFYSTVAAGQKQLVFLDLDKYNCEAGRSIWFKGYVTQAGVLSSNSTNLFVELFTSQGHLIATKIFPIYHGLCIGQLTMADTLESNNYYIVAFTKAQLNYQPFSIFSVPVLVYNKDRPGTLCPLKPLEYQNAVTGTTIKDVTWITNEINGHLSSFIEIDSLPSARHFVMVAYGNPSSPMETAINLSKASPKIYSVFPIDTSSGVETLLLYESSKLIGRQYFYTHNVAENILVKADTLDFSPGGYNSLEIRLPDTSQLYYTSISVEDAKGSIPSSNNIYQLHESYTEDLTIPLREIDTGYISYSGKATRQSGKPIKGAGSTAILVTGTKDSNFLFTKLFTPDEQGNFMLDSLFFFDNITLEYQLNGGESGRSKDVRLQLNPLALPTIDSNSFLAEWEGEECTIGRKDSSITRNGENYTALAAIKSLRPVTIMRIKDPRQQLDERYTSGPFSEPALYYYDLRNDTDEYNRDIFSFINAQPGRLHYDMYQDSLEDDMGHPVHYYVDEIECSQSGLRLFDFDRLAYIKVLESDFLSTERPTVTFENSSVLNNQKNNPNYTPLQIASEKTPINVLIYQRKENDFRTMRGGLNKISIKGYDQIKKFSPDNITQFWNPWETRNNFRVCFMNKQGSKGFRIKVSGMTADGKLVFYEKVIQ